MSPATLAALLTPYSEVPHPLASQLLLYLDLLLKWNERTNLTAIRTPEEIVRRHFGESLFAAAHLGPCSTLLDFGSGAGFPGIPIQLAHPHLAVTLAESQGKKAAFLREAIRTLNLSTEVWPHRVEQMADNRTEMKTFDVVTLRAVDDMAAAVTEAARRATRRILLLTTSVSPYSIPSKDFILEIPIPIPATTSSALLIANRR
jgi:16S rRNA (guanine527-N7)-methyltransferase